MTDVISNAFSATIEGLRRRACELWSWPSPEAGYALFLLRAESRPNPPELADSEFSTPTNLQYGPELAIGGYLIACNIPNSAFRTDWSKAIIRFSAVDPFPNDHQSFAFRPVELFGISLGAKHFLSTTDPAHKWLSSVVARVCERQYFTDPWSCLLIALAADALTVRCDCTPSSHLDTWNVSALALASWIINKAPGSEPAKLLSTFSANPDELLLKTVATSTFQPLNLADSILTYVSLSRVVSQRIHSHLDTTWQISLPTRDAVRLVSNLCQRFALFQKQLTKRHNDRPSIDATDEYDVQDLLHAVLKLHFDDVRPEEWTPSYAGSHSRMDFLLKNERIVVEVKLITENLNQKRAVDQLAVDKERYRSHQDCGTLICFIYDPELRCENSAALERDVSEDPEAGLRVIAIVSPKGT